MNIFCVTGNIGRNIEIRQAGQHTVGNFPLAVKSGYGEKEQTLWLDCSLWGNKAESRLVDYLAKGQRVSVSGELGTREYQTNNGENKTVLTLRIINIDLEGGAGPAPQPAQQPQRAAQPANNPTNPANVQQPAGFEDFDDDIPF